jgi:WhiB family transcriptional regulator, redox-sensing transcriptional regulator
MRVRWAGKPAGFDDADGWRYGDAETMSRTSRRVMTLPADRHWRLLAACRSADPDLFFPISSSGQSLALVAEAKAICAECQVRRHCLAFALRTHQIYGVWGGLTEQERHPLISAVLAEVERGQAADVDTVHAPDRRDDYEQAGAGAAADHCPRSA